MQTPDLVGAVSALVLYVELIALFLARLAAKPHLEFKLGLAVIAMLVPLVYLLFGAIELGRPIIYFVQIGLMIVYLLVELGLDYIWKVDFRHSRGKVATYVTLFFGAAGGMIGVASHAGSGWTIAAVAGFLIMGVLAFVQRRITGM